MKRCPKCGQPRYKIEDDVIVHEFDGKTECNKEATFGNYLQEVQANRNR